MRFIRSFAAILLGFAPISAAAEVNCSIFDAIERIQFAQTRLALIEGARFGSVDANLLIDEVKRLDPAQIPVAHGGEISRFEETFVQAYLTNAQSLAQSLKSNEMAPVSAFFADPNFKLAQDRMARLLPRLNCNPLSRTGTAAGNQRVLSSIKQTRPSRSISYESASLMFIAALLFGGLGLRFLAHLKTRSLRKKRQSKRFHTHIETRISAQDVIQNATILDISCNGAKVQVEAYKSEAVGSDIHVWIGDCWHPARISWFNAHYIGLKFDRPLRQGFVQSLSPTRKTA